MRYFAYVLVTVNAVMAGIFLLWAVSMEGPGLEVIVPVTIVVSVAAAWAVIREFSRPD